MWVGSRSSQEKIAFFQTYKILKTPLSVRQFTEVDSKFKGGLISSSDPIERKTTDVPDIKARVGG